MSAYRPERWTALPPLPALPVRTWLLALTAVLATGLDDLGSRLVNVAPPHIAGDLDSNLGLVFGVQTAYLTAYALGLALAGWLAQLVGRNRCYLGFLALFVASSALSGAAPNVTWLLLFQTAQGLAGGGLLAGTQILLLEEFPRTWWGLAFALLGAALAAEAGAGPRLGIWLTDNYSWRWLFWLNVAAGSLLLLVLFLLLKGVPAAKPGAVNPGQLAQPDLVGLGLVTVGVGALLLALQTGENFFVFGGAFCSPVWLVLLPALALLSLVGLVFRECLHPAPVLNFRLLADRNFLLGVVIASQTALVAGLGRVTGAGLRLGFDIPQPDPAAIPAAGAFGAVALMYAAACMLSTRAGARRGLVAGLVLLAAGYVGMTVGASPSSRGWLLASWGSHLAGTVLLFVLLNALAYSSLPREDIGKAVGLFTLSAYVAEGAGVMLAAWVRSGEDVFSPTDGRPYVVCLWACGTVTLLLVPLALWMRKPFAAGDMEAQRRERA